MRTSTRETGPNSGAATRRRRGGQHQDRRQRGVDASIEALGLQQTFEQSLRVIKPGGTLSSLGVYAESLTIPLDAFCAGLGDHRIITSLCPGGKERMRRLMQIIDSGRIDLGPMVTHRYPLEQIVDAYDLFSHQRDGVLKIALEVS
ncbi:zinc-binding dehydrogenase [Halomonas sp. BM-2019]|uniref:zinc-binding dehydrogenase n=1 Tax=Halomonas sp. BM-2019 TaxID=2811227 RepID=UPI0031FD589F